MDATPTPDRQPGSLLDLIERIGNRIPEPPILFFLLTVVVVALSAVGAAFDWEVRQVKPQVRYEATAEGGRQPVLDERGRPEVELVETGTMLAPRSLVTPEGFYWFISSLLRNFTGMPSLGLIFVAMLGIFVAVGSAILAITPLATATKLQQQYQQG